MSQSACVLCADGLVSHVSRCRAWRSSCSTRRRAHPRQVQGFPQKGDLDGRPSLARATVLIDQIQRPAPSLVRTASAARVSHIELMACFRPRTGPQKSPTEKIAVLCANTRQKAVSPSGYIDSGARQAPGICRKLRSRALQSKERGNRQDWLAVRAVCCEPVSAGNSLFSCLGNLALNI